MTLRPLLVCVLRFRADGRPSLCSSEYAGGFRVAGGAGALHEESVGGADVHDQARVGSLCRTRSGIPCVNARIQDGVFHNSSGVSSHASASYLDALLAAPARAPAASTAARRVAPSSAVVGLGMHDEGSPVHDAHNSWSNTGRVQGPTGIRRVKGGVSGPAEDLRPVSEVEAGVNFRPAGGARGQFAGSLPRKQPGPGTRQVKGRCGHTFPPPGGSWYPIRVTWIRIGHQAIDGLDEGVWNHTVGNLGAKG